MLTDLLRAAPAARGEGHGQRRGMTDYDLPAATDNRALLLRGRSCPPQHGWCPMEAGST
ncbi:hypothetical protein NKH18_24750 [Streptomyces sp. M10(2022)]